MPRPGADIGLPGHGLRIANRGTLPGAVIFSACKSRLKTPLSFLLRGVCLPLGL